MTEHTLQSQDIKVVGENKEFNPYKHVVCRICNEFHSVIHSHIRNIHNITIKEYKEKFPQAEIESQEVKDKRVKSITKSWEGNDKRRELHSKILKENNPMHNKESYDKVCNSRKGQPSPIKGCSFDGTPCKNPTCNGRIHPDRIGENNPNSIKIRNEPEYLVKMQERAEHMRKSIKWTSKTELVVRQAFEDVGMEPIHNHGVKGLLYPTAEHPDLNKHQFDIILPKIKTVVEVNGCYYHGCCVCNKESTLDYIHNKIHRYQYDIVDNIRKDEETEQQVSETDWKLIVIWEHEVKWVQKFVKSIIETSKEIEKVNNKTNNKVTIESIPLT